MQPRIAHALVAPDAFRAMINLDHSVRGSDLEHQLLHLVRLRASQINGCAYCIDMHSKDARAAGESEQRLYALSAWREAPFFTTRERAALAWTEALTLISQNELSDEFYLEAREHFSEKALVYLTTAIVAINGWNRFAIAFRPIVGEYEPGATKAQDDPGACHVIMAE